MRRTLTAILGFVMLAGPALAPCRAMQNEAERQSLQLGHSCMRRVCHGVHPFMLDTLKIYVEHVQPGDELLRVGGSQQHPLIIEVHNGFFNGSEFGQTHFIPNPLLFPLDPELQWDTFFSIGYLPTIVSNNMPRLALDNGGDSIKGATDVWWSPDINETATADDDGRLFIAQLTYDNNESMTIELVVTIEHVDGTVADYELEFNGANVCKYVDGLCPGDFNQSQTLDTPDLLQLLSSWGPCGEPHFLVCDEDLNCDLVVDQLDLLIVLNQWGPCP